MQFCQDSINIITAPASRSTGYPSLGGTVLAPSDGVNDPSASLPVQRRPATHPGQHQQASLPSQDSIFPQPSFSIGHMNTVYGDQLRQNRRSLEARNGETGEDDVDWEEWPSEDEAYQSGDQIW